MLYLIACLNPSDSADTSSHVLPGVEAGSLSVCLDGQAPDDRDTALDFAGTLLSAELGACGYELTIEDESGAVHVAGVDARDADGVQILPALDAEVGGAVTLSYRTRMVWGVVGGFAVFNDTGLILAAEEGTWGGALQDVDLFGLSVDRGDEVVAWEEDTCQPHAGTTLVFTADETLELTPVSQGALSVGGLPMTASAIAAWDYAEDPNCSMSDTTGHTTWMVSL